MGGEVAFQSDRAADAVTVAGGAQGDGACLGGYVKQGDIIGGGDHKGFDRLSCANRSLHINIAGSRHQLKGGVVGRVVDRTGKDNVIAAAGGHGRGYSGCVQIDRAGEGYRPGSNRGVGCAVQINIGRGNCDVAGLGGDIGQISLGRAHHSEAVQSVGPASSIAQGHAAGTGSKAQIRVFAGVINGAGERDIVPNPAGGGHRQGADTVEIDRAGKGDGTGGGRGIGSTVQIDAGRGNRDVTGLGGDIGQVSLGRAQHGEAL